MEHAIYKVLRSTPINRAARQAVRQGNCSYEDMPLSRVERIEIFERLMRKQRLLKHVLGIKNRTQYTSMKKAANGKSKSRGGARRVRANPRAAQECIRCGLEMERMHIAIYGKATS